MTKVGAIIAREMEEREEFGRKEGKKEGRIEGRKEGRKEGKIEGQQSSLITVLSSKGEISNKLKHKIQSQTKNDLLQQWLEIAANASDVATFEEQIMQRKA